MAELCLEFANTLSWRGSDPPSEALRDLDDLLAWCASAGAQDDAVIDRLGSWWRAQPAQGAEVFSEAIGLREVMYRVLSGEPASADLGRINDALRATPQRKRLERDGDGYAWQTEEAMPSTTTLLAPVLWSAGDLLTRPEVRRVRQCANDRCRWLFLDDSKNASRRWCSMSMCGNRAKAHRHYLRTRHCLPSP